ncbi:hypothetical protein CALVIDRAFT_542481 [Calocera viscosa TUFC12733]|uniref:Multidrug resistance-associated ABC transporter n=1 Tax=Calocera viscosa (strain TUFC12733) TaxID=1330018 RepID=A0A167GMJ4_CALVF|nr:hypothetical protein CALVIDRAFT_542481 [Calocera viscosa TUFC12733]
MAISLLDPFLRGLLACALPSSVVLLCLLVKVHWPKPIRTAARYVAAPFDAFITLAEAKAILHGETAAVSEAVGRSAGPPLWKTVVLAVLATTESLAWVGVGTYDIVHWTRSQGSVAISSIVFALVKVLPWLYATITPLTRPQATAPYDLFVLHLTFVATSTLIIGAQLFKLSAYDAPLPSWWIFALQVADLVAPLLSLGVVLSMPIALPINEEEKKEIGNSISPEDYTSLYGWVTFAWVGPLVWKGRKATLNEEDVWTISPTLKSQPLFEKYRAIRKSSTLRSLAVANSLDLILDCILSFVSSTCAYAGPFFLKRILDAITSPTPERRSFAFLFAALSFGAGLLKAESDLLHLWNDRRISTRLKSELMADIYEKALRRKDFSGVANKDESKQKDKEPTAKAQADVGKIVQLMSGDVEKISMMAVFLYNVYTAPFEIAIALVFLYQLLGWAAFTGVAVLVVSAPLNTFMSKLMIKYSTGLSAARDKRMSVMTELIQAIKFIKFFAWESQWIDRAMKARQEELSWLIKSFINMLMFRALFANVPALVSILSFLVYVAQGKELTVSTAFTAIALFDMLRMPLNLLPYFIVRLLETTVSFTRIDAFLAEPDVPDDVSSFKRATPGSSIPIDARLGAEEATFKWNENEEAKKKDSPADEQSSNGTAGSPFELSDINIVFPIGKLSVVTGPTASGKTALLMALLGEMTMIRGKLLLPKDPTQVDEHGLRNCISYAAQTPWLEQQSIKENILFGSPFDAERYEAVIEACALKPDLTMLEDGDQTEIGARGVSLSGGQKARVALARASYARTKTVLLDDPLAALDSHSARFVFEHLLQGPLMEDRTVVLVTHHVDLVLPAAYYLVRMLDGRIDTQGTTKELREKGVLSQIVVEETAKAQEEDQQADAAEGKDPEVEAVEGAKPANGAASEPTKVKKPRRLVEDETKAEGSVDWRIYRSYLAASSLLLWGGNFVFIILYQCFSIAEKYWIKIWGQHYAIASGARHAAAAAVARITNVVDIPSPDIYAFHHIFNSEVGRIGHSVGTGILSNITTLQASPSSWTLVQLPNAAEHPFFYIGIYAAIGMGAANVAVVDSVFQTIAGYRGGRILFGRLLKTVIHAPIRWFDTTPTGRILNRFSRDMQTIDSELPGSLRSSIAFLSAFIAAVLTVGIILPPFLLPALVIGLTYYLLTVGYLNTSRDLRRMESTTRSPIFSGFADMLDGITTVRAFSAERRFFNALHAKVDRTQTYFWFVWMLNRWLLVRFDSLGALSVFLTTIIALSGWIDVGMAGLTMTLSMTFTMSVYWTCRCVTQLEMDLNSVERVVEYCDLPSEPPLIIEGHRPPAFWPSNSDSDHFVMVENLEIAYSNELEPVLHDVSFKLAAREKIGLLGRTGSGKSTLAMSFLRFIDPRKGQIVVDGIDITTIGLQDLRSRITFIPQDAVLFSGTIRDNLDPFGEHTDDDCWDALRRVHLISESRYNSHRSSQASSREPSRPSSPTADTASDATPTSVTSATVVAEERVVITLETQVSSGGSNFSQGQRQLIALARALLRQSAMIIMDEATASVDFETDSKIQATIRNEFSSSLLLTIAHRIRTIIDYDRLLVLDAGRVAEFDTPINLLNKQSGIFKDMCLKSGTYQELYDSAGKKAAER